MNYEEVKVRAKQLSLLEKMKNQEERLQKEVDKEKYRKDQFYTKILKEFAEEFEKSFVIKTFLSEDRGYSRNRALRLWRAAQKVILAIDCDPSEWYYNIYDFYDYFHDRRRYVYSQKNYSKTSL